MVWYIFFVYCQLIEVFVSARSNNVTTQLNHSETSLIVRKMRKSPLVIKNVSPALTPSYNKCYKGKHIVDSFFLDACVVCL